jgi:formylglycine-generating enzyme required for sulfatase activity
VIAVYIEATADDTETRLLKGLRKHCPDLPEKLGVIETLAALRRGHYLPAGKKVVLILDQFEQWLHAKGAGANTELVQALRHCDGARLQCIVMVRDDFWLAVSRFMKATEVEIEGRNSALVDLFDLLHARKVLAEFGRAFGRLPDKLGTCTKEQEAFLDQAVSGLAQEGKVISVRLALFAEMVKGKPWTPATLKEVGGMEGVGVTFLEETFTASTAPPQHRLHQKAAQAVLKALLPDQGTDIKGNMRSQQELLEASGYAVQPRNFDALLRILDGELRLITPTDPEGVFGEGWRVEGGEKGGNDDSSKLQAARSVAVRHGPGAAVLPGDKEIPQGGVVRVNEPDSTGGGIDSGKHRRGAGQGAHEGVPQPPEHRPRLADGTGNPPHAESTSGSAGGDRVGEVAGDIGSNQPDAQRPAQGAPAKTQRVNPALPSTVHPPPSTRPSTLHPPPSTRYYQLTHDYLVPSLRDWLSRKQKETRRGRAQLRLAERSALWKAKPQNRHLPTWWEYLNIRFFTRRRDWKEPERKMMGKAERYHVTRGAFLAILLTALTGSGLFLWHRVSEDRRATHVEGLVNELLSAKIEKVPETIDKLELQRSLAEPLLKEKYQNTTQPAEKLHAALALLRQDKSYLDFVYEKMLAAEPQTVATLVKELDRHKEDLLDRLWQVVGNPPAGKETQRLPAACALAQFDPNAEKWPKASKDVADDVLALVQKNPSQYSVLLEILKPVRSSLLDPLSAVYRDKEKPDTSRAFATSMLAEYAQDRPEVLADLLMDADEKQFAAIFPKFKEHSERGVPVLTGEIDKKLPADLPSSDDKREKLAKRQANAAVGLLKMNQPEKVWPLLKHSPDPRGRSYLIHRFGPLGADAKKLWQRFQDEKEVSIQRALLLGLGDFGERELNREACLPQLLETYRSHPDAGLHGAAEFLLRQWQQDDKLKDIDQELATGKVEGKRSWYVNKQGQTFAIISPKEFWMGSPPEEAGRFGGPQGKHETKHWRKIGRTFAVASKEVTVAQFRGCPAFKNHAYNKQYARTPDHPVNNVTWYQAAEYCNWLSREEGLPECYEPIGQGKYAEGMKMKPNYLNLTGYRLPTEAEWEYACRSEEGTSRYYGETDELLRKYAWFSKNSLDRWMLPVGRLKADELHLKPNDFGLFHMLGNAMEWCQDPARSYRPGTPANPVLDLENKGDIEKGIFDNNGRLLRGGSFSNQASTVRSADRLTYVPADRLANVGFRVARTLPPDGFPALQTPPEGAESKNGFLTSVIRTLTRK